MRVGYIYNNEAIAIVAIYSVLSNCKSLEYNKVFLILPMMLNDRLVSFFNGRSVIRSIEELMIKKGELLVKFNSQYYNFLYLTYVTIILMQDMGLLIIDEKGIALTNKEYKAKRIGKRAERIIRCSKKVAELLKEESSAKLYLQLRVII